MKCVPSTLLTSWKFLRRWRPNVADNTLNLSTWRTTALSTLRELYDISWAGWRASNELNLLTSRTILQLTKSETVYKKLARSVRCSCEQLCIWNFSLAPRTSLITSTNRLLNFTTICMKQSGSSLFRRLRLFICALRENALLTTDNSSEVIIRVFSK